MRTLGIGSDGDLDFSIVDGAESVRQRVVQHLRYWLATWYLNRLGGIPYLPDVVGSLSTPEIAKRIITDAILSVTDVTGVSNVQVLYERDIRELSYSAEVATIYGDVMIEDVLGG